MENKFRIERAVEEGLFLIFKEEEGIVSIYLDEEKIGTTTESLGKGRKILAAKVLSCEEEGEEYSIQVEFVRHVNLHAHSGFSFLDGASKVDDIVAKAGYAAVITDHGWMPSAVELFKKSKKAGKKPVFGFEAYSETITGEKSAGHLVLLAKNMTGYKNLMKLTSFGYDNFYNRPQVNYEKLREYGAGLIATSACMGGEIPRLLMKGNEEKARQVIEEMIGIFGPEDFYIEIQRHGLDGEEQLNRSLIALAKAYGLKTVATTDSHYTNKENAYEQEILLCIGTHKPITDPTHFKFNGEGYFIHTDEEFEARFSDLPEAIDSTIEIASKCNVELDLKTLYMPEFKIPAPFASDAAYMEHLAWKGFDERFSGTPKHSDPEYRERLDFELQVIKNMGFPSYFLIVWDFVDFAKRRGILVGPGRGSACGSLAAYCLKITELDPIPYGLLFERFLNPDRISMPDIDLDFDDVRREEVIDYVKSKYGEDAVSRIITFGTLAAKAAVKDVARALGYEYAVGDAISKAIPNTPKITLEKALKESVELAQMYDSDRTVKEIIDIAKKLEGLPRNKSVHACGIIISKSAVNNYIPQTIADDESGEKEAVTQFTMGECEEMGLLKMDFLGLRNMGVISRALVDINKRRRSEGKEELSYDTIPIDDVAVYDFISKGNTEGVFQLESAGMTGFMKELFADAGGFLSLPEKERKEIGSQLFERLIAGIALYRPGPMDEIGNYLASMNNPSKIHYDHEKLIPILKNTYGVIVYQEQVIFTVRELAGFSKGQADTIRKAMGKKIRATIDEYAEYFIYGSGEHDKANPKKALNIIGCINNGIPEEVAKIIWDKMQKFAEYAFNKSHAAGYADIAAKTAWLAYHYPVENMCAILNSIITKSDKIRLYMAACKKKDVNILPPDVNLSQETFCVDGDNIRFGLMGIRNLGQASSAIIEERTLRGEFQDFQDFAERMALNYKIDKKILEALIFSSAVDCFEGTRRAKQEVLPMLLTEAGWQKNVVNSGQLTLFDMCEELAECRRVKVPDYEEFDKPLKLKKEKEFAGFYVTEHPLDQFPKILKRDDIVQLGTLVSSEEEELDENTTLVLSSLYKSSPVKVVGILKDIQTRYSRKDSKPLKTMILEDKTAEIKCVAFNDCLSEFAGAFEEDAVVALLGTFKVDTFGPQIVIQKAHVLSH